MEKKKPIKGEVVIVFHSDKHHGSEIGLAPPKWFTSDGKNLIEHSQTNIQKVLWDHWIGCWDRVWKMKLPVVSISNGDEIDGDHHGVYSIWSKDPREQADVAVSTNLPQRRKCYAWYATRGTPSHVGEKATWDEYVARELGATTNDRSFSHYRYQIEVSGVLIDASHHGPRPGRRIQTVEDEARRYAKDIVLRHLSEGLRPPDIIARSHVHLSIQEEVRVGSHRCHIIVTPAFQAKTEFAHKVVTEDDMAHIGLAVARVSNGNVLNVYDDLVKMPSSKRMIA